MVTTDLQRGRAKDRAMVLAFLTMGAALLTLGAIVAWNYSTTIYDWGEVSLKTRGSKVGLALMGTGGLLVCSLTIAAALAGVFSRGSLARPDAGALDDDKEATG